LIILQRENTLFKDFDTEGNIILTTLVSVDEANTLQEIQACSIMYNQMTKILNNNNTDVYHRITVLDTLLTERINSVDEQMEINCILSDPDSAEFYLFLINKLDCVMNAFKCLSTGMMIGNSSKSLRSTMIDVLKGKVVDANVVRSVDLLNHHVSCIPGCTVIVSTIKILFTIKGEWEQLRSFARVTEFATKAAVYNRADIQVTWERCARYIVRAKCHHHLTKKFTTTASDTFGKVKQGILFLLADSTNTPIKQQASNAADCIFSHIMKPDAGS
jgi:hypothetical protein